MKSQIAKLDGALDKVLALAPKKFLKRHVAYDGHGRQSIHADPPSPSVGFVAQELRDVFPDFVHGDESKEFLSVSEGRVAIMHLAAFQEFVVEARRDIAELKAKLDERS